MFQMLLQKGHVSLGKRADEEKICKDTAKVTVVEDLRKRKICSRLFDSKAERPSHNATTVKLILAQRQATMLDHPLYLPDLPSADYFLFPKVKFHLKERNVEAISNMQKAVKGTLNTTTKTSRIRMAGQICVNS
jgi:hypothetical protein